MEDTENIIKVSETEVQIETTTVETETLTLDQLIYDRESLAKTVTGNNEANAAMNADILAQIDELDAKIVKVKDLGVRERKPSEVAPETRPMEPVEPSSKK